MSRKLILGWLYSDGHFGHQRDQSTQRTAFRYIRVYGICLVLYISVAAAARCKALQNSILVMNHMCVLNTAIYEVLEKGLSRASLRMRYLLVVDESDESDVDVPEPPPKISRSEGLELAIASSGADA